MKSLFVSLAVLLSASTIGSGQEIGVDICSCAPGEYEFQLDFSLFCPPVNITQGDAVDDTSCSVTPFADPSVTDLVPVAVNAIDIQELSQDLRVIVQESIPGSFGDGDTFSYRSFAALPGEIVDPNDIPRAIQLNIVGVNQFDESIINVFLITFTNNCGAYPVLFEGQSAGWTRFRDLTPPISEVCPIASEAPTPGPTPETPAPTVETPPPTPSPTLAPTMATPPPTMMSMSMSMSMSMTLDLMDAFDEMEEIMAVEEFGTRRKKEIMPENKTKLYKESKIEGNGKGKGGKGNLRTEGKDSKKGGKGKGDDDDDEAKESKVEGKDSKGGKGDDKSKLSKSEGKGKGGKGKASDGAKDMKKSKPSDMKEMKKEGTPKLYKKEGKGKGGKGGKGDEAGKGSLRPGKSGKKGGKGKGDDDSSLEMKKTHPTDDKEIQEAYQKDGKSSKKGRL